MSIPPLQGWQASTLAPTGVKPGDTVSNNVTLNIPSGIWGKPVIPIACKLEGQGWQMNVSGKVKLAARAATEQVTQWMIVGPFTRDQPWVTGDTSVYPPQRSLDINSEYRGAEGLVRWQPIKKGNIDFSQQYGQVRNGVAFAMAVIRVTKTTTLAITTSGNSVDTYLDSELLGLPEVRDGNFKASATLTAGNHVLLCAVPMTYSRDGTPNPWNFSMKVETGPGTAPGTIEIVEVEKFGGIAEVTTKKLP